MDSGCRTGRTGRRWSADRPCGAPDLPPYTDGLRRPFALGAAAHVPGLFAGSSATRIWLEDRPEADPSWYNRRMSSGRESRALLPSGSKWSIDPAWTLSGSVIVSSG